MRICYCVRTACRSQRAQGAFAWRHVGPWQELNSKLLVWYACPLLASAGLALGAAGHFTLCSNKQRCIYAMNLSCLWDPTGYSWLLAHCGLVSACLACRASKSALAGCVVYLNFVRLRVDIGSVCQASCAGVCGCTLSLRTVVLVTTSADCGCVSELKSAVIIRRQGRARMFAG
jgi:hypothetical protein